MMLYLFKYVSWGSAWMKTKSTITRDFEVMNSCKISLHFGQNVHFSCFVM
jgi:hypothetical protein